MPETSKDDRYNFLLRMRVDLIREYYFLIHKQEALDIGGSSQAIKELFVRLNLFIATAKDDKGKIDYPEAGGILYYNLDASSIDRCHVKFHRN